ncbi:MAG: isoprenyl transferase [Lachnospiraceae bacterium]|nr:isoprenyl transferase [Lachnospiraceae bacterium]
MDNLKIPSHVAVILDGNGRWAKSKGLPRKMGHVQGGKNVEEMLYVCDELGIKYFTVYAFSTENWKRSEDEVSALMMLLRSYLSSGFKKAAKNNVRIRIIGDKSGLAKDIQDTIAELEEESKDNTGLQFQIAINYGSRDEITRMMKDTALKIKSGELNPEDINEAYISDNLDTKDIPDPDLLIRTSGEMRLSNFLLWQLAYSEFYFADCHWPDFNKDELIKAIESYTKRDRRFGNAK